MDPPVVGARAAARHGPGRERYSAVWGTGVFAVQTGSQLPPSTILGCRPLQPHHKVCPGEESDRQKPDIVSHDRLTLNRAPEEMVTSRGVVDFGPLVIVVLAVM